MNKVTITDVARAAGVGIATASRAFNGMAGVSEATRRAVLEAARALRYAPDSSSRKLAARRHGRQPAAGERGVLGYLFCEEDFVDEGQIADARLACEQRGYGLESRRANSGSLERHLRELWACGIEGLLVRSGQGTFPPIPREWRERFRLVLLGNHPRIYASKVNFDFAAAVIMAHDRLVQKGCRRIAFWLADDGQSTAHLRAKGMVLALQQASARRGSSEIFLYDSPPHAENLTGAHLWIERCRPDALVAPSSQHIEALRKRARGLLDGLGDRVALYGGPEPGIASFGFEMSLLHRIAVRLLIEQIHRDGGAIDPLLHLVSPVWSEPSVRAGARLTADASTPRRSAGRSPQGKPLPCSMPPTE